MPEVTVKYKSVKALKALEEFARLFDMVEKPANDKITPDRKKTTDLPITFAKNPDLKALAGIWEGRDITLEQLRTEAWGDRL